MYIAQRLLDETHYYLIIAKDLSYADTTTLQSNGEEVARMLTAYSIAINA
jgi:four helix bundle protein